MRWIYNVGFYLLSPLLMCYMLWRGIKQRAYLRRWGERYGFAKISPKPGGIWVHAVSVGEFQAAIPLIKELQKRYPDKALTITTMTPTGSERVQAVLGDSVEHCYAPYDYIWPVKRFLDQAKPSLAIVIETEIWPNLFHYTAARDIPIIMASARLSPRSVRGYRRLPGPSLVKQTLSLVDVIAAQGQADARRFLALGANPDKLHVHGNIKFDFAVPEDISANGWAMREQWGQQRFVLVVGSTHEGEEELILDAYDQLLQRWPDMLLVLVPRHPQRFATVAQLLQRRNYRVAVRSANETATSDTQIYLIDTLGELTLFYAAADVTFVAGSLEPIGGHNLLEPAALGKPVLTGPHLQHCEDIAQLMQQFEAVRIVQEPAQLFEQLEEVFADEAVRTQLAERALRVVDDNRGAIAALLQSIEQMLEKRQ